MLSKNRLKELAAYRQSKRCEEDGVFVVEGAKMADEALRAAVPLRCVCATAEWWQGHEVPTAADCHEVSQAELERLSLMRSPNQVWMLAERYQPSVAATDIILALDCLQDPGNLGTILRAADWFGVRHVVCSLDTVSHYNPKVVQASMGAVFRTRVDYTDLPTWLAQCGLPVVGASLAGRPTNAHSTLPKPSVLLVGNEGRGISAEAMQHVSHPVLIPNIGGTAESLNAAMATAILLSWMTL